MLDPIKEIKAAYKTLLTGLTYNGSPVPVFIGEANIADNNFYIVLGRARTNSTLNKHSFIHVVDYEIEIHSRLTNRSEDIYSAVDGISQAIFDLVIPSITDTGLVLSTLELRELAMSSSEYLPVIVDGTSRIIQRNITFKQTITQNGNN